MYFISPMHSCTILQQPCWCRMEAILIALGNLFRAVNSAYLGCSTVLLNLLIFPTYVLTTGNPLTSTIVFTTLSLVTYVRVLTFFYVVEAVLGVREMRVAIRRIQVYHTAMRYLCACGEEWLTVFLLHVLYHVSTIWSIMLRHFSIYLQDFLLRDHSDHQQLKHYSHKPVLIPELNLSQHLGNDLGGSPPQTRVLSKGTSANVKVNNLSAAWTGGNGERINHVENLLTLCTLSYICCVTTYTYLHCVLWSNYSVDNLWFCLEEPTLQNISFECNMANRMLAIVGPVGAGKVSLPWYSHMIAWCTYV